MDTIWVFLNWVLAAVLVAISLLATANVYWQGERTNEANGDDDPVFSINIFAAVACVIVFAVIAIGLTPKGFLEGSSEEKVLLSLFSIAYVAFFGWTVMCGYYTDAGSMPNRKNLVGWYCQGKNPWIFRRDWEKNQIMPGFLKFGAFISGLNISYPISKSKRYKCRIKIEANEQISIKGFRELVAKVYKLVIEELDAMDEAGRKWNINCTKLGLSESELSMVRISKTAMLKVDADN